jgi:hypothetical protein
MTWVLAAGIINGKDSGFGVKKVNCANDLIQNRKKEHLIL